MKQHAAAVALVVLGIAQMIGDVAGILPVKGIAAATNASPAPKVFSAVRGLETYSTRFFIEWPGHSVEVTPEMYSRLEGPYNRRNVYGAALSFAPVLPEPMRVAAMRKALCGEAPLLREIGLDPQSMTGPVVVRLEPLPGTEIRDLPTRFEAPCHR